MAVWKPGDAAAAAGEAPSPADVSALASAGLVPCDADVRDEGDMPFAGEWVEVERAGRDDPGDGDRRRARAFCYFEPKSVGGAQANWNCCVDLEDDYLSLGGTWPDCFTDVRGAIGCMESYFGEGGLLEEHGWRVSG